MRMTSDYLLGRRFEFSAEYFGRTDVPDVTCIAFDPQEQKIYVHATDGGKWWLPVAYFSKAVAAGAMQESIKPPFVINKDRVERLMNLVERTR